MTREELSKLAKENCRDIANATDYVDSAAYDGIIFGAKAEKEYLLEKAKEWLEKTLYIHTEEIEDKHWNKIKTFDWVTSDFDSVSDFIEGFCKAMEE